MYKSVSDVRITRNDECAYLFDLQFNYTDHMGRVTPCYHMGIGFDECQQLIGEEPIDYARIDDDRYLLII